MNKLRLSLGGLVVAGFVLLSLPSCQQGGGSSNAHLTNGVDSMSYSLGASMSKSMNKDGLTPNPTEIEKGYNDFVNNTGMPVEQATAYTMKFQQQMSAKLRNPDTDVKLNVNMDSLSYCYGLTMASQMKDYDVDFNGKAFSAGVKDGNSGSLALDSLALAGQMGVFSTQMQQKAMKKQQEMMAEMQKDAAKNKEIGAAFLAENGKKSGVKTTKSGLQYKVLKKGSGKKPSATSKVEVHYHGTLLDGTVFDSSVDRGQTIEFGLNQVIPGWTEGVQLMSKGAKYKFFIPSDLAYGDRGTPGIPAGSTLIFDVELFDIK